MHITKAMIRIAQEGSISANFDEISCFSCQTKDVPIYEFRCESCGKTFATLVGMTSDPDEDRCPHCKSNKTTKLVSRPGKFRTEFDRLEELADRLEGMSEPSSYREMRDTVRELGSALDDSAADEMEEMLELDSEE